MSFLKHTYPVLLGAAILSIVAFYNGYPLLYSDAGTYIDSGFRGVVPIDRPFAYGMFVRLFGSISLWTVVIMQNLISSYILFESFKTFFEFGKKTVFYFYTTLTFLTLFTGISWYSNQIMPDFLTPLVILSIFILFFKKNIGKVSFGVISVFLVFAIITHFSHVLVSTSLVCIILLLNFLLLKKWLARHQLTISFKRAFLVGIIGCSGWLVLPSVNKLVSGEFYTSKTSHVFFMASMADKGILKSFLKDNCKKPMYTDCKLCLYKNEIPRTVAGFIWDGGDSSVFNRTGGWYNSKVEYDKIIRATLVDPKYASRHLYMSVAYGCIQLFENEIGNGLMPNLANTGLYNTVEARYNIEYNFYLNSKQANLGLVKLLNTVNVINLLFLALSLLLVIYIYFSPASIYFDKSTVLFLSIMLLGIVLNSMITAGLSAPYGRYQARVVWLMQFALIVFIIKNWSVMKGSIYSLFKKKVDEVI